jgi:carbon storage regulator CsrA
MLILTRKRGEDVILTTDDGTRIVVRICYVDNRRVKIGFNAPDSVKIFRSEIECQKSIPEV